MNLIYVIALLASAGLCIVQYKNLVKCRTDYLYEQRWHVEMLYEPFNRSKDKYYNAIAFFVIYLLGFLGSICLMLNV